MHCLRVAESFSEEQILSAVRRELSWTHLKTIAYENDPIKRKFYMEMAINQQWNTRTLAEQIDKMLYERTAIAQQPGEQIEEALQELKTEDLMNPDLFFKNTYILDFLGLKSASDVIASLKGRFERLVKIVADGGYRGELIEKTKATFGWILEIVLRSDSSSKFTVIPKRWVVERTFAWFETYRRLSKDFEFRIDTSEAMIQFAMIKLMLNRIKK